MSTVLWRCLTRRLTISRCSLFPHLTARGWWLMQKIATSLFLQFCGSLYLLSPSSCPPPMYSNAHTHAHTVTHVHTLTHAHTHTCTHTHTCSHIHTCTHAGTCTHSHMHTSSQSEWLYKHFCPSVFFPDTYAWPFSQAGLPLYLLDVNCGSVFGLTWARHSPPGERGGKVSVAGWGHRGGFVVLMPCDRVNLRPCSGVRMVLQCSAMNYLGEMWRN